jgi:hypothetical protein
MQAIRAAAETYAREYADNVPPDVVPAAARGAARSDGLEVQVDGATACWLASNVCLLGLRSGAMLLLQLRFEGQHARIKVRAGPRGGPAAWGRACCWPTPAPVLVAVVPQSLRLPVLMLAPPCVVYVKGGGGGGGGGGPGSRLGPPCCPPAAGSSPPPKHCLRRRRCRPQAIPAPHGPVMSCAALLTAQLVFMGSETGDSTLLRYGQQQQGAARGEEGPAAKRRRMGGWLACRRPQLGGRRPAACDQLWSKRPAAQCQVHRAPMAQHTWPAGWLPSPNPPPPPAALADGGAPLPFSPESAPAISGPARFSFLLQDKLVNLGPLRAMTLADLTPPGEEGGDRCAPASRSCAAAPAATRCPQSPAPRSSSCGAEQVLGSGGACGRAPPSTPRAAAGGHQAEGRRPP